MRGLFISLEGIDGAGKSTHVEYMRSYLQEHGYEVVITREPGGTEVGEALRDILLNAAQLQPTSELLLYFASRQELISQVIVPNLDAGRCVIADRFIDASMAYQGGGRGFAMEKLQQLCALLTPQLTTDITFLFDAPLAVAWQRLQRSRSLDRIEAEPAEFFARVQASYRQLAQAEPQRIKVINTDRPLEQTRQDLTAHLAQLLSLQ